MSKGYILYKVYILYNVGSKHTVKCSSTAREKTHSECKATLHTEGEVVEKADRYNNFVH